MNVLFWLNPRRIWLWILHKKEIKSLSANLLPTPYSLEAILQGAFPDFDKYKFAAETYFNQDANKRDQLAKNRENYHRNFALDAAEGFALYGGEIFEQLHAMDPHIADSLFSAFQSIFLNTANLSSSIGIIPEIAHGHIPEAFENILQSCISGSFQHADDWCHSILSPDIANTSTFPSFSEHINAATDHASTLSSEWLQHSWLNPSDAITGHPVDYMVDKISGHSGVTDGIGHLLGKP